MKQNKTKYDMDIYGRYMAYNIFSIYSAYNLEDILNYNQYMIYL